MVDRFLAVGRCLMCMLRSGIVGLLCFGFLALTGCQTVTMPDMSNFNLDILKEKPVVAIKANYGKVNIRPTPSTEKAPVATLKGGDKMKLYEESGNWLKVTFYNTSGEEQEGWVYKYLVEGYNKPVQEAETSSNENSVAQPEIGILQVEQETNEQELPKSESVSPL